ncbi:MAG: glycosyltransferase family 2 protein [bacterium]
MVASIPHQLTSLTIVLPFFNDAGTVTKMLDDAYLIGPQVTSQLPVIAIHGGPSSDDTYVKILSAKSTHPSLQILDESRSGRGYAVIATGLKMAQSEWVFYTDGDAQYDLKDLLKLVKAQSETGAEVVNGYKSHRQDSYMRVLAGGLYARLVRYILRLPIRDPHCDFRLIKTSLLADWHPRATGAAIIQDLITHLKRQTQRWAEVEVSHHERVYGTSNYTILQLARETLSGMLLFWRYR